MAGGWTPPHGWWACLLPPLLPEAVQAPALCQSFTRNYCYKWSLMAETDLSEEQPGPGCGKELSLTSSPGCNRPWHRNPMAALTVPLPDAGGRIPTRKVLGGDRRSQGHAVPVLVVGSNPGQGHAVCWSTPKPHQSGAVGLEHHSGRVQGGENGG